MSDHVEKFIKKYSEILSVKQIGFSKLRDFEVEAIRQTFKNFELIIEKSTDTLKKRLIDLYQNQFLQLCDIYSVKHGIAFTISVTDLNIILKHILDHEKMKALSLSQKHTIRYGACGRSSSIENFNICAWRARDLLVVKYDEKFTIEKMNQYYDMISFDMKNTIFFSTFAYIINDINYFDNFEQKQK
jgi:hypothetical protein